MKKALKIAKFLLIVGLVGVMAFLLLTGLPSGSSDEAGGDEVVEEVVEDTAE